MQTQNSTTPAKQAQVQLRFCRHCSKPIKPWNESGYCADHCYIAYRKKPRVSKSPRSCAHCGKILGPQNKHGAYCTAHRLPSDRAEKRFCEFAGVAVTGTRWGLSRPCSSTKPLRADNQTGRCMAHRDLLPSTERIVCADCKKNRLGNNNKSGLCRDCRKKSPLGEQDRVAARKRAAEYTAAYRAGLREKEAKADRIIAMALPDDWTEKPAEWVFIGLILRQRDYLANEELALCLDASGGPKCRYSEDGSWGVITRPGQAANLVSKIRKWVDRPGRPVGRK